MICAVVMFCRVHLYQCRGDLCVSVVACGRSIYTTPKCHHHFWRSYHISCSRRLYLAAIFAIFGIFLSHSCCPCALQSNPKVYLDLQLGRSNATPLGRIVVELKEDVVPKTAKNFEELSKAEPGNGLKGSRFHRVITDFMCQVHVITSRLTQHWLKKRDYYSLFCPESMSYCALPRVAFQPIRAQHSSCPPCLAICNK